MDDSDIIGLYFSRDERAISETAGKYGRLCKKHCLKYPEK